MPFRAAREKPQSESGLRDLTGLPMKSILEPRSSPTGSCKYLTRVSFAMSNFSTTRNYS
jgi:hypothetical protein